MIYVKKLSINLKLLKYIIYIYNKSNVHIIFFF